MTQGHTPSGVPSGPPCRHNAHQPRRKALARNTPKESPHASSCPPTPGLKPSSSGFRAAEHSLALHKPFLGPHFGHRFHPTHGHGITPHTHSTSQRANAASRASFSRADSAL
eukprot:7379021-Prymnesium_polylepis.1